MTGLIFSMQKTLPLLKDQNIYILREFLANGEPLTWIHKK